MKNIINVLLFSVLISIMSTSSFANNDNQKTLLIFSAGWCKYCTKIKQEINLSEDVQNDLKRYNVVDVNFDVDKGLVRRYNVKKIPTLIIVDDDGKELNRHSGFANEKTLKEFLK